MKTKTFRFFGQEKDEANYIVDTAKKMLKEYSVVSIADVKSLINMPTAHVDHRRGWTSLDDVKIEPSGDTFLVVFPQTEVI